MELVFATNNQHKIQEVQLALPDTIKIITLKKAGIDIDIPEPHATLEENAKEKGITINLLTKQDCFSEDTGLEVGALKGAPGVRSARYAGDENSSDKNIKKLLEELAKYDNRSAQFRTIIFLLLQEKEYYFEGICKGVITNVPKGKMGFGYDSVFIPDGADKTFAEMSPGEKNGYSHRKKAVDKLVAFLNQQNINSLS